MAIRDNLSKGGKKKLFEALQYSGLVTEDMTFSEMCEALAIEYPAYISLVEEGALQGNHGGLYNAVSTCNESYMAETQSAWNGISMTDVTGWGGCHISMYSKSYSGYSKLKVKAASSGGTTMFVSNVVLNGLCGDCTCKFPITALATVAISNAENEFEINLSNITGNCLITSIVLNASGAFKISISKPLFFKNDLPSLVFKK